jgi:hypothetical protein
MATGTATWIRNRFRCSRDLIEVDGCWVEDNMKPFASITEEMIAFGDFNIGQLMHDLEQDARDKLIKGELKFANDDTHIKKELE